MGELRRDTEFTTYVVARRAHLFRAAYLLTGGDAALAEDVVQQTLTRLYTAWPRVSRADSVDAYARRVLVNAHVDERRRPWRRERPVVPAPDGVLDAAVAAPGVSLEDVDALHAALRTLAPRQRQVVVLRHYLGLSVEETADDLGISPGTVKSQTSDALDRLRAALAPTTDGNRR